MSKNTVLFLSSFVLLCTGYPALGAEPYYGKAYTDHDVYADTWVATDALNRSVADFAQCGPVKNDKWVGIFYWTWHIPGRGGPNDNSLILPTEQDGLIQWPESTTHHWGEPEMGYYLMTDPFVIRKHASMLTDAGIDVILFDTTNPPFTWKNEYEALCREYMAMRSEGAATPSIAFIAPFGDPRPVTDQLWQDLYQPGHWQDLWFIWDGKPLLLANKDFIHDEEQQKFFTFRRPMPDYWIGPTGPDQWSWLEVYPQHVFKNSRGENEQMSVGVAQNAIPNTPGPAPMSHKIGAMGRSWHQGQKDQRPGAVGMGLNFSEQWCHAISKDPQFVFVTGWNEWIMGRYTQWSRYTDADCYFPGGLFVDQYDQEYSRDCEPMRNGHTDNYYYQLADWVRRFKGVRKPPRPTGPSAIAVDGNFKDWDTVQPEFRDTIGDTLHRNHKGYGDRVYTNTTGRNDIVITKAAYDQQNVYFYVQTHKSLTPSTGMNWMLLLLDTDQNAQTGWLGYDFVVNLEILGDSTTTIKKWKEGVWETVATTGFSVNGNGLELAIPRDVIQAMDDIAFDFHWADHIQSFGDISELGLHGDSAPNRRWNYRFQVSKDD
jgi:hypothetical protein